MCAETCPWGQCRERELRGAGVLVRDAANRAEKRNTVKVDATANWHASIDRLYFCTNGTGRFRREIRIEPASGCGYGSRRLGLEPHCLQLVQNLNHNHVATSGGKTVLRLAGSDCRPYVGTCPRAWRPWSGRVRVLLLVLGRCNAPTCRLGRTSRALIRPTGCCRAGHTRRPKATPSRPVGRPNFNGQQPGEDREASGDS